MEPLMSVCAIPFPNFDPVAIADRSLRHQVVRARLSRRAGHRLALYPPPPERAAAVAGNGRPSPSRRSTTCCSTSPLGVVLGGRLGYVLLYEPSYYLVHPADILAVWKGGMSFHGALVGCAARHLGCSRVATASAPGSTADLVTAAVPIGLFFGRIANFINGELFGPPDRRAVGHGVSAGAPDHPGVEPRRRAIRASSTRLRSRGWCCSPCCACSPTAPAR